ncbi:phospho-acceptor domain-containing protein [Aneurinibacillus soli]|uniref:histidine kinase n=1 Tax=Aneurinibacillus soli TaxID=1500254 RepID=A0A0U4NIE1_9BACL|nr:ATP-binding protein [Aneurinibacillus soli]PYE61626.1 phospho-acceptor domain-containing protein [Aneurinibacillus soli]BAU28516.1 Sensor histidine kinase YycG [Aneurinibacillus soli]
MIYNVRSRIRDWKKDLFVHTQNRLTFQYSALLMVFLALFITIVYFLVNTTISHEQEQQLQLLADQQASVIKNALQDGKLSPEELDNINALQESGNQFFYEIVDPKGQMIFGKAVIERLQPDIFHALQGWIPQSNEIRYETMLIHPKRHKGPHEAPPHEKDLHPGPPPKEERHPIDLMMTGRAIYQGDQLVGVFYTGKDVSFYYELSHRLLIILVTLGILFLGIAFLLSYFMSRRAMIPIRNSFERQQELVADVSHELRTPLSILNSSLDVFKMEEDHLSDFSRKVLGNMQGEIKRMTKLVSDLLTLARSDSGVADLQYERFDLVLPAEQLMASTQTLAHSKEINLQLNAPSDLLVYGDQERIKQLLYILLDNAIKYTPNGGEVNVTLSADTREKQPVLRIVVQDTGSGIPLEEQGRIFDRFYRVDKNRSRQLGGTGLGLSIAKWIVEAHHGMIQVTSTPGKGSTFTVRIPH